MSKDKVYFIHQRAVTVEDGLKFAAYRGGLSIADSHGGRTIAYTYNDKGVRYAIAKVSPKDRYVKETGRTVASARLCSEDAGFYPGKPEDFRKLMALDFDLSLGN